MSSASLRTRTSKPRTAAGVALRSLFLLVGCHVIFLVGCQSERSYEVRGRVAGFGDDGRTLIVEHEDIPGLMPAMTMPFEVRDSTDLSGIELGDAVSVDLVLAGEQSWIDNVSRLPDDAIPAHPAGTPDRSRATGPAILERGDQIPDAELLSHADTTFRLSDLRGKRLLITFIYTSCPVPDFCPLMSRQFARLQSDLDQTAPPVHLLSISFDPSTDTPTVLRDYAARYTDDLSNWTFATGDSTTVNQLAGRFGVFYRSESGQIIHNLVTVLVDAEGIVRGLWRGNDWRPTDVMARLEATRSEAE